MSQVRLLATAGRILVNLPSCQFEVHSGESITFEAEVFSLESKAFNSQLAIGGILDFSS